MAEDKEDPEAAGKTEAGKTEAGKTEAGKTEAGKTEAGKTEAGKTNQSNDYPELEVIEGPSPKGGLPRVIRTVGRAKRRDKDVRFILAIGLLIIIGIMAIGGGVAWALLRLDLKELLIILSPVIALAGSVFSFYFAEQKKSRSPSGPTK